MKIALVLHDIRSVHNVGSIFRTADAAGVSKIYLTGVTPTPSDRFGRPRSDLAKVALGAEKNIAFEYSKTTVAALKKLKKEGFEIIALEQNYRSKNYKKLIFRSLNSSQTIKSVWFINIRKSVHNKKFWNENAYYKKSN